MTEDATTDFAAYGAQLFKGALKPCLQTIEAALSTLRQGEAGLRLHGIEALRPALAYDGCVGAVAASILGASAKPVRAILFNKSPEANWSLAWHQDRTICVREKCEVPGFGPWTVKSGLIHVAPPFDILTRMVTLRAHLDDVPTTNAPLLISPGSHLDGRVAVEVRDRAMIIQRKTGRPVQFEVTADARTSLATWLLRRDGTIDDFVFPSRIRSGHPMSTRQYARLVDEWVTAVGLRREDYGTHSMRRTKAAMIYRTTGNLRAVQILLGHSKIENTVRYLGVDVEDALVLAERIEI